jgi:SAM-dependent methyltransferase
MHTKPLKGEVRSGGQLLHDYEIEKKLAMKLRNASRQERQFLYSSVYDEYFERVPLAPQLITKSSPELTAAAIAMSMKFLNHFLNEATVFLEVGPGDCALSIEVSKRVKQVFAVDVSAKISEVFSLPYNCKRIISDGRSIPVANNTISVVYSNQLMEHLHPDDAFEQLQNIYHSMIAGGYYICITPNRHSGPHDISKYFDLVATGFHLREYSVSELVNLFKRVGFSRCDSYVIIKGCFIKVPILFQRLLEMFMSILPNSIRVLIARTRFRLLLGVLLVGKK